MMDWRRMELLATLAVCCGLVAMPAGRIAVAADADFLSCQSVEGATARLACYDKAAGRPVAEADSPAPTPHPTLAPPAEPTALFGLPPEEARKQAEKELGRQSPDVLEARITGLRTLATGKREFELDNGQRWEQTDTTTIRLKTGESIRIRRAMLGSYLLQRAAGGTGLRVRRIT